MENYGALLPQPSVPPAHLEQNHLEHLQSHDAFLADPAWNQRITPEGKQAMEAHIQQHVAMLYFLTETNSEELMDGQDGIGAMGSQPGDNMVPGIGNGAVPEGSLENVF